MGNKYNTLTSLHLHIKFWPDCFILYKIYTKGAANTAARAVCRTEDTGRVQTFPSIYAFDSRKSWSERIELKWVKKTTL